MRTGYYQIDGIKYYMHLVVDEETKFVFSNLCIVEHIYFFGNWAGEIVIEWAAACDRPFIVLQKHTSDGQVGMKFNNESVFLKSFTIRVFQKILHALDKDFLPALKAIQ